MGASAAPDAPGASAAPDATPAIKVQARKLSARKLSITNLPYCRALSNRLMLPRQRSRTSTMESEANAWEESARHRRVTVGLAFKSRTQPWVRQLLNTYKFSGETPPWQLRVFFFLNAPDETDGAYIFMLVMCLVSICAVGVYIAQSEWRHEDTGRGFWTLRVILAVIFSTELALRVYTHPAIRRRLLHDKMVCRHTAGPRPLCVVCPPQRASFWFDSHRSIPFHPVPSP